MIDLIQQMQKVTSSDAAEKAHLRLETEFVPNQVLQGEVSQLIKGLVAGLTEATELGRFETWEPLGQVAAGAVPPNVC